MIAGEKIKAGPGYATVLPTFDFETYSEAGYVLRDGIFKSIVKSGSPGLPAVGLPAYAEHLSTEILSLAYDLKDGAGTRQWLPGMAPPADLIAHIEGGGLIEAHNSMFEFMLWHYVARGKMGWPALPLKQLRDSMAKCRAWSIPGALGKAAMAIDAPHQKDKAGEALMKLTKPRKPTKALKELRFTRENSPDDFIRFDRYGVGDVLAESSVSELCPDLRPEELDLWLVDQAINVRGVQIDTEVLAACISITNAAFVKYNSELWNLTSGAVEEASQLERLKGWLAGVGWHMDKMDADAIDAALEEIPESMVAARRALEIRALVGSASIKKVFALDRMISSDGRMRDIFRFCGADRTGRWAGAGPQPQNMPKVGPDVVRCGSCEGIHLRGRPECPYCGDLFGGDMLEWGVDAVEAILPALMSRDLARVEREWGDALLCVKGVLRGLFIAAPGHDLICSDYSAIEAVVAAFLTGEEWRMEVFRTHGKIYEMGASKITGVPFEEMMAYKAEHGSHHPDRAKIGKISELAYGFGGWIGGAKAFGADKFMSDDEIKASIVAWREASPNIVEAWGGQVRGKPWRPEREELYGFEGCVIQAVQQPGKCFEHRGISYGVLDDVLYCRLLSGRLLAYHSPRLNNVVKFQRNFIAISYMGYNSDYKKGPMGWTRIETYSGKLFENVVQATARDILAHAMKAAEAAGYKVVLHVHDEMVAEVAKGFGSVEELEEIMGRMPEWCKDWPIRAAGGWRGLRYRKE